MTNAHPPEDEHSLVHGWWLFCAGAIVWLCFAEGGIVAAGMWPNLPWRVHGMSIGCSQSEKKRFRLCFIALWCWGRAGCLPGNLASWALATFLIACRNDFLGGLPIPYGIRIAIGVSESIPYRDCIVNRNSISDFRPGISAAKSLCKNSVSDFGVPYGTARAIRNSASDRFGSTDFRWKRRRARLCAHCRCLKLCGVA